MEHVSQQSRSVLGSQSSLHSPSNHESDAPTSPADVADQHTSESRRNAQMQRFLYSSHSMDSRLLRPGVPDLRSFEPQHDLERFEGSSHDVQGNVSDHLTRSHFPQNRNIDFGAGNGTPISRSHSLEEQRTPSGSGLTGAAETEQAYRSRGLRNRVAPVSSSQEEVIFRELQPSASMPELPLHHDSQSETRIGVPTTQEAAESLPDEILQRYTERVIDSLHIPAELHDQAREQITGMYRILERSQSATSKDDYDAACRSISELAPGLKIFRLAREGEYGKAAGVLFRGGKETRLETNNIRTRGELKLARETPEKSIFYRWGDTVTHAVDWRLNEPGYRAMLATSMGAAGSFTPLAYTGKMEPIAIPINIAATYADTAIFKNFDYPWNLFMTTAMWQGVSFSIAYTQLGIDKLAELVGHGKG